MTLPPPPCQQTDLCNCSAFFIGKVFTAGGFTDALIWRQYSVSHCLFFFPSPGGYSTDLYYWNEEQTWKALSFIWKHYIEGKYIKYNSNSGFVRDDNIRLTPQVSLCSVLSIKSAEGNFLALFRGLALLPRKETAGFPVQCQINFSFCSMSASNLGPAFFKCWVLPYCISLSWF